MTYTAQHSSAQSIATHLKLFVCDLVASQRHTCSFRRYVCHDIKFTARELFAMYVHATVIIIAKCKKDNNKCSDGGGGNNRFANALNIH